MKLCSHLMVCLSLLGLMPVAWPGDMSSLDLLNNGYDRSPFCRLSFTTCWRCMRAWCCMNEPCARFSNNDRSMHGTLARHDCRMLDAGMRSTSWHASTHIVVQAYIDADAVTGGSVRSVPSCNAGSGQVQLKKRGSSRPKLSQLQSNFNSLGLSSADSNGT